MWAMIVKEFRELRRDRRTMALLVLLPLLLLIIFGYAANFTVQRIPTGVYGPGATEVAQGLHAPFVVVTVDPGGSRSDAEQLLVDNKAVVALVTTGTGPATALVNGSQLLAAQQAIAALERSGSHVSIDVLFNPQLKTSWVMIPAIIGMILAFIGTVVTSLGLVRERQAGTLEQLAVMPFRPSDVIAGKIAPYFVVGSIDMVIVTILGVAVFGVPFNGMVTTFALGAAVFLLVVLGMGILISTVSENQGQAVQTAIFFLLPQILLSGMVFPLTAMPVLIRWIGYCLPLTYFIQIAQGVMLRGESIAGLWLPFVVLTGMALVVFGAAVLRFRRDLAPGSPGALRAAGRRGPVSETAQPAGIGGTAQPTGSVPTSHGGSAEPR
jgi:ABC-2 type transport system permease protein